MSTGKRLAKRSILGTRVACWLENGKYYPGVICDLKNYEEKLSSSKSPEVIMPTIYTVRIEGERKTRELREGDLVGSGFTPVNSVKLRVDQRVFITYNGREVQGDVLYHRPNIDEVLISITNPETGVRQDVKKRLEDIRLLESRKSPRLADQDTDFAKLADCATDRTNRKSCTIDVPGGIGSGSRKRRSSRTEEDLTDECAAALVLMKLSCSPRSPILHDGMLTSECFSGGSSVSSGVWSLPTAMRSATPSPPLLDASTPPHALLQPTAALDDGIDLDDLILSDDAPRKRRSSTRIMFRCTWSTECDEIAPSAYEIEKHIRTKHLGRRVVNSDSESDSDDDHEEEFYWTEVEVNVATWVDHFEPLTHNTADSIPNSSYVSSVPTTTVYHPSMTVTLSPVTTQNAIHVMSASPLVQKQSPVATPAGSPTVAATTTKFHHQIQASVPPASKSSQPFSLISSPPTLSHMDMARPPHEDPIYQQQVSLLSSSWPRTASYATPGKVKSRTSITPKTTTGRGKRGGESRKCRKVYGMDQRDQWCTQCKWKKACSRFCE